VRFFDDIRRKPTTPRNLSALIQPAVQANVAVLLALKGEEYGWVCLASCVTDVSIHLGYAYIWMTAQSAHPQLQVALNAMALSWVTARSYSHQNVPVDRFSLPTMDVGPLMLMQNDREQGKEQGYPESSTMQTTLPDVPSPLIQSFYDYIPRDQRSENDAAASETGPRQVESRFILSVTADVNTTGRAGLED
jgi:hypothetical protein